MFHYMKQNETKVSPEIAEKYECISCNYICSKKCEWSRHIITRKHKNETNETGLKHFGDTKNKKVYKCETCNIILCSRTTMWRHKKTCYTPQNTNSTTLSNVLPKFEIDKELLIKLLLKNQDVMEKMMEIMPIIGSNSQNTTNSHNTTNNQFNIQMFLNEHCKNAMNLTDFIDSLPITAATYDSTIENGLTKTITNMITNGLNKLDILERPIHCTDATRKTLYVKEADIWEKDTELLKVVDSIKTLIRKKRTLISRWKEANRGWDTIENKQMRFTELICNIMTDVDFDEKETGKIVRSISKSVYLDSEDKKKYIC